MPEPTTADRIGTLRGKVEKWTPQGVSDVMCSLADLAGLLAAYDHAVSEAASTGADYWREREAVSRLTRERDVAQSRAGAAEADADTYRNTYVAVQSVLDQALGTREEDGAGEGLAADVALLAARAAAAEAAVQRATQEVCRECRDEGEWLAPVRPADFILWGKLLPAEALGPRCHDHAAKWLGRGMEQVDQYAVFDLRPLRTALSPGSAGLPGANPAGKAGHDATASVAAEPVLPANPAPTSVSGIVNAAPDDQPVTVTGWIQVVEPRVNRARAPFVELVLADRSAEIEDADPDCVKVVVPAHVFAGWDIPLRPREGTLVEVTGRAIREVAVIASGVREVEVDQS